MTPKTYPSHLLHLVTLVLGTSVCGVVSVLAASAPSLAIESADCTWEIYSAPSNLRIPAHARIQIQGAKLLFTLDAQDFGEGTNATHFPPTTEEYKILENNSIGVVAGLPRAEKIEGVGPVLSSEILLLSRANGRLKIMNIGLADVDEVTITGQCTLK
jgi:hypothetical protein